MAKTAIATLKRELRLERQAARAVLGTLLGALRAQRRHVVSLDRILRDVDGLQKPAHVTTNASIEADLRASLALVQRGE